MTQDTSHTPLVTVYLPTHNRVQLLERAAASVLAQTHENIELIIVDDASTDETPEYLKTLSQRDARVRVFSQAQAGGAPRARNKAICAARGEFITGLDDDDWFKPSRIAEFVRAFAGFVRAGRRFSCLFSEDECVDGCSSRVTHKPNQVESDELYFFNLIGNQVFTRTEYLVAAGLFDPDMPAWQDLDMFIRLLRHAGPALRVDSASYVLNLERNTDRISVGSKQRILHAYHRLSSKQPRPSRVMHQGLFLQVFGTLYGHRFEPSDAREFLRFGLHRRTLRTFAGLMHRQLRRLSDEGGALARGVLQRSFRPVRP